jgi:hypothetical protein
MVTDGILSGVTAPSAPATAERCRYCGSTPTLSGTVYAVIGLAIIHRTRTTKSPFCRGCGIAAVRDRSAQTLVRGWWGITGVIVTPFVLLINLIVRLRLFGIDAPTGAYRGHSPEPQGRPLFLRWQIIGLLVPVAVVLLFVYG